MNEGTPPRRWAARGSAKPKQRPWARHYQDAWLEHVEDETLPHWLRVAALAYGSHGNSGHAQFKRGEIAEILGTKDRSGVIKPYRNLRRAIAIAIEKGWLAEGSFWGCLIVPERKAEKGEYGVYEPCPRHEQHMERIPNRSLSEHNGPHSSTLSERFEPRTAHSVSASKRKPLFSVLYPATVTTAPITPHNGMTSNDFAATARLEIWG